LSRDTSITCGASHASKRQIVVIQSQNSPNFKKLQIIQDCSDMTMLLSSCMQVSHCMYHTRMLWTCVLLLHYITWEIFSMPFYCSAFGCNNKDT